VQTAIQRVRPRQRGLRARPRGRVRRPGAHLALRLPEDPRGSREVGRAPEPAVVARGGADEEGSDRARALLPATPGVSAAVPVAFTFGCRAARTRSSCLGRRARARHRPGSRARGPAGLRSAEQIQHLSRMIATEAYARAVVRVSRSEPRVERPRRVARPARAAAARGRRARPDPLYGIDENFFRSRSGSRSRCARASTT
jgi:hypothetical protein